MLHRGTKEGLGRAYLDGFRWALARDYDQVLEMDCDFSHDPARIRRCAAVRGGADLALGSRYVPGGGVLDWGLAAGSSRAAAASTRASCSGCPCTT